MASDLTDILVRAANLCDTISVHFTEFLRSSRIQYSGIKILAGNFLKLCDVLSPVHYVTTAPNGENLPTDIISVLSTNLRKTITTLLSVDLLISRLFARDKKKGLTKLVNELSRGSIEAEIASLSRSIESEYANLRMSSVTLNWMLGDSPAPSILGPRLEGLAKALDTEPRSNLNVGGLQKSSSGRQVKHHASAPSLSSFPAPVRYSVQDSVKTIDVNNLHGSVSSRRDLKLRHQEEMPRFEPPVTIRTPPSSVASPTGSRIPSSQQDRLASTNTSTVSLDELDYMMEHASFKIASRTSQRQANEIKIGQGIGKQSSLILALQQKQAQRVETILAQGIDLSGFTTNLLTIAIMNDDVASANSLLRRGFNVNSIDKKYGSALHAVTHLGSLEFAKILLINGADINASSSEFPETVLSKAVIVGNNELTQLYLQNKADCNKMLSSGETTIISTIKKTTNPELIRLVLDYGADANLKAADGRTPLFHAATLGHVEIMSVLLDKGAKPNLPGPKHPLWPSVHFPGALKLLLSHGSKPEMAPGLLELAASTNNVESLTILLDAGIDPNIKKDNVYTPLCTAIRDDRVDIVKILLARGADPNLAASEYPTFKCITHDRLHILPLLLSAGAELNDPPGILEAAVASQDLKAVIYLLRNKAEVNIRTPEGRSALTTAIREGSLPILECLLNHGADPNMRGEDWPLSMAVKDPKILERLLPFIRNPGKAVTGIMETAVKANQLQSVKLLLKAGVNVEDKTGGVFSPLTTAVRENHVDIVRFLIAEGKADVNAAGEHLPLIKAIRRNTDSSDTRVIELLLEHGADINLLYRGWNAVMQGVEKGDAKILRLLIEKGNGVDLHILEPESDQTVFEIIKERGWHEGVSLLLEHQQQTRMIASAF